MNTDLHAALWMSLKQPSATAPMGLIFPVEAQSNKKEEKEKKDEAEVCRLQLHACCLFVYLTNGTSFLSER